MFNVLGASPLHIGDRSFQDHRSVLKEIIFYPFDLHSLQTQLIVNGHRSMNLVASR